jgi:RHS repeat-associated protein
MTFPIAAEKTASRPSAFRPDHMSSPSFFPSFSSVGLDDMQLRFHVGDHLSTKEFDEEGTTTGRYDFELKLDFDQADYDLDKTKYNVVKIYYTEKSVPEASAVFSEIPFVVDETKNEALAKKVLHFDQSTQVKWVRVVLDGDPANAASGAVNCSITPANENVGPGNLVRVFKSIAAKAELPPTTTNFFSTTRNSGNSLMNAYYFGRRYYDPELGYWTTVEPEQEPQDWGAYTYCGNNPTNKTDPNGRWFETALDALSLGQDAYDFVKDPTVLGAGMVLWDVAAVALPAVPGSWAVHAIEYAGDAAKFAKGTERTAEVVKDAANVEKVVEPASLAKNQIQKAANEAHATVGEGKGSVYGTKAHSELEANVNKIGNENLHTEVSFKNGQEVARGTRGSVRIDVGEGKRSAPHTVYDLKTGNAKLTQGRVEQIKQHIPSVKKVEEVRFTN